MQVRSKFLILSFLLAISPLAACTPADENAIPYGDVVYTRVAPGSEMMSSFYEARNTYPFATTRMDGVFVFRSTEDIAKKPMSNRAKRRDDYQPGSWQYQIYDISVDLHDDVVLPSDLVELYDEGFFQKHDLLVVMFPTSEAFRHTLTGITHEDGRVVVSIDEAAPEDRPEPLKHLGPCDQPSGEELWHDGLFRGILIELPKDAVMEDEEITVDIAGTIPYGMIKRFSLPWSNPHLEHSLASLYEAEDYGNDYRAVYRSMEEFTASSLVPEDAKTMFWYENDYFKTHDVLAVKLLPQSTYQYTITDIYYQDGRLTVCAATLEWGAEFSLSTPPVLLLVDLDKDSVPADTEIDLRLSTILLR